MRVLVVDDEIDLATSLAAALTKRGYPSEWCSSTQDAEAALERQAADIVVSDLRLHAPEGEPLDGLILLDRVRKRYPETVFVCMTAYSSVNNAVDALRRGAFHYLQKPFQLEEAYQVVDEAAALARAQRAAHQDPYRVLSRSGSDEFRGTERVRPVLVGGKVTIGNGPAVVMAGPCAVEGRQQTIDLAKAVADAGGDMLRGGAYKPRTSPYEFQGLGEEGLDILAEARAVTGLPVVTEVMDPRLVGLVAEHADMIQIGSRSMQNFPLLREVGMAGKPVLLKRGFASTLMEWLCAAEYIAAEGNLDIVLCERGIRTFSQGEYNRNSLDLNVIAPLRRRTFVPVCVDPSHGTGRADMVPGAAIAGIAEGAHALIIEVIGEDTDPKGVRCDGTQSIRPSVLARLIREVHAWDQSRIAPPPGSGR